MASLPYRFSSRPSTASVTLGHTPTVSLEEVSGVTFHEAHRFKGAPCIDMYGDLPYGSFELPNATVRGEPGYIFTAEGLPILEQNASFLRKGRFLRHRFETLTESGIAPRSTDSLVSLASSCHSYFWHWMMDSLPKVILAEESGFSGTYLVPSENRVPWATESLELLGIPSRRIIHQNGGDIHARTLFIPTFFCGYNALHNAAFIQILRERIRAAVTEGTTKEKRHVLIGRRSSAKVRRVVNQDAIAESLASLGFCTLYFEDLSLREQIALARSAEALIGSHGSGLTHALFMDEGSLVVELFPYGRKQSNECYETISQVSRLRYRALESERDHEGDIEVSPETVRATVEGSRR
jgi:Glycosyltransferase 61